MDEWERERFSRRVVPFLNQHTVEMEIRNMFLTNLSDDEDFTSCFDFCADFIFFYESLGSEEEELLEKSVFERDFCFLRFLEVLRF